MEPEAPHRRWWAQDDDRAIVVELEDVQVRQPRFDQVATHLEPDVTRLQNLARHLAPGQVGFAEAAT